VWCRGGGAYIEAAALGSRDAWTAGPPDGKGRCPLPPWPLPGSREAGTLGWIAFAWYLHECGHAVAAVGGCDQGQTFTDSVIQHFSKAIHASRRKGAQLCGPFHRC